jgi:Arc/MetJ-type ribon-helix-helix transcriptional regulator
MTQLKPHQEQLVQEAINSGHYQSVDEFLDEALSAWKSGAAQQRYDLQTARAAAASIRELRKGITLGGLKIKDLVAEGRR